MVRFAVTLSPAAALPVTIHYATSDGTARAGDDYEAAAGTLTFAPGETAKTIDVQLRSDEAAENKETFLLELSNASGARVARREATGIIDDDDQAADLSAGVIFYAFSTFEEYLSGQIKVDNRGPRAATMIAIGITATPDDGEGQCVHCVIEQIKAGSYNWATGYSGWPSEQVYLSATATARERDPSPSDNSVTWAVNAGRSMTMTPAFVTEGQSATVYAKVFEPPPLATSSDPSVVSISSTMTPLKNNAVTFTVTAHKQGTATISMGVKTPRRLLVNVVVPGATPRWPGAIRLERNDYAITLDKPLMVPVTPSGRTPVTGLTATGELIVSVDGQEIARRTIAGAETHGIPIYFSSIGYKEYRVDYSGDANFLPQTITRWIHVLKGIVTIRGSFDHGALSVRVAGSPVVAPTGTVVIFHGTTEIARANLNGDATAELTLPSLPDRTSLTVSYLGDTSYEPRTQQIDITDARRRSAHH